MKSYRFTHLLTSNGWQKDVSISVDAEGVITSIGEADGVVEDLHVAALPGFQNAHSHCFQYAMAGLAERHSTHQTPDDFWSWREAMYSLALTISPDQLKGIAKMLYAEMLRHGYTHVAEFHYLHHDKQGNPYANLSEMGEALVGAAAEVGIGITLIPIFYQKGGFGKEATEGQRRFLSNDYDEYLALLTASQKTCEHYTEASCALGIHSMRAVEMKLIKKLAAEGPQDLPYHIHIAEQLKEIDDCLDYLGSRPVEWMLDNLTLSDRFHLVHATHLSDEETQLLARSGANVVLCPSTEGNLGDGIFPLRSYQENGGNWSIGTDSHVGLNPLEELRILDYGQRLISHKRNTFYSKKQGDSGLFAVEKSLLAGRKAMGNFEDTYFKVGEKLNAALYNLDSPLLSCTDAPDLASTILYSTDSAHQYGTIAAGKLVVKNGVHQDIEGIQQGFAEVIGELKNR